ncbi:MAG TPA: replication initiation factor domain-containing protein [Pedobacter sp.]
MDAQTLTRNVKIDWLRFQVVTYDSLFFRKIREIIGLPFEKKQVSSLQDARETNVIAAKKVWHESWEFQGSLLCIKYPPTGIDEPFTFLVDLNGSTLDSLDFDRVSNLLYVSQLDTTFTAHRIDIALDFPVQSRRLFAYPWESLVEDGLLFGYKKVRRISNFGSDDGNTVYIGSRESSRCLRIYCKLFPDGRDFDRLEAEFKRERALWIMKELAQISVKEYPRFLNGVVCGQVTFTTNHQNVLFFSKYKYGSINVPAPTLHLDIEKSIKFFEKHAPTLAMIFEFMGPEEFDKFIKNNLQVGKRKMGVRHNAILSNAKALGFSFSVGTAASLFLFFFQFPAFASGLTCPAPVPLSLEFQQKFPIDIVNPTPSEQAYFNNIGDGCFQINSGLNFDRICLPGMSVNALRPFVIMGMGLRFIFSD